MYSLHSLPGFKHMKCLSKGKLLAIFLPRVHALLHYNFSSSSSKPTESRGLLSQPPSRNSAASSNAATSGILPKYVLLCARPIH